MVQLLVVEPSHVTDDQVTCVSKYGEVTLDRLIFTVNGMSVRLKPKGAKLVRLLMVANGETVPYAKLLQEIGYHPEAKTHTIETHIYRIRNMLRVLNAGDFIQTMSFGERGSYSSDLGYCVAVSPV